MDRPLYPVGAIGPTCRVRTEVEAIVTAKEVRLRFFLVNGNAERKTVKLRSTCPGGVVRLGGLPAGFDPMHTCQRGACVRPQTEKTFSVPGGRTRVAIGETRLRARGDACNPALPLGSTFFTANISSVDDPMDVCSGGSVHVVRDHKSGKLRRAKLMDPPVPATPAPITTPAPVTKPAPKVTPPPPRTKPCPTCAFACLRGVPTQRVDANGCRICGCDDEPGF